MLARCLTIPVVVEAVGSPDWNEGFQRMFFVSNPVFATGFVTWFFTEGGDPAFTLLGGALAVPQWAVGALAGLCLAPLVYRWTEDSPHRLLVNVYVVVAFLSALFWINVVADELVSMLQTLGAIYSIDSDLLGLTVLAMGNSLGDMAANLAVARGGYPNMAVTACYAGPFFNMCIGIGVSFVIATLHDGTIAYAPGSANPRPDMRLPTTLFISSAWIIVAMLVTLFNAVYFKFQLPRKWGYGMVSAYAVFLTVIVCQFFFVPADRKFFDQW
eukprot:SAG22_NODE_224_length_14744_cov_7.467668_4_plen_271_part_00